MLSRFNGVGLAAGTALAANRPDGAWKDDVALVVARLT